MLVHIHRPSHNAVGVVERLFSDGQAWHLAVLVIRQSRGRRRFAPLSGISAVLGGKGWESI